MFEMEENSRNERVDRIYEQLIQEFKHVYGIFSRLTARINGKELEELEIENKL